MKTLLLALLVPALMAAWPPELASVLPSAGVLYVATQRKDGSRSSAAPVWFAIMDGAIWIDTGAASHKVKRLQRGSPLFVAPRKGGPFFEVKAEIVRDGTAADRLGELYRRKYWLAWLGLFRPRASRVLAGETVLIKLMPKE